MTDIFGWIGDVSNGQKTDRSIDAMTKQIQGGRQLEQQVIAHNWGAMVVLGGNGSISHVEGKKIYVAHNGMITWKDKDLAYLSKKKSTGQALLEGYLKYGFDVLLYIEGSFSFVLYDDGKKTTIVATDRSGICPVYFTKRNKMLVFGSTASVVAANESINTEIDPQGVYNYLYFHVVPAPGSIYKGISRLLPGSYLMAQNGNVDIHQYWEPDYTAVEKGSDQNELKSEFFSLMRRSVEEAANENNVGAFLSGGTDSSTIVGFLSEVSSKPAKTYSIGFDEPGYDEMEYARIASRHFKTEHHEYYVTPEDVVSVIPQVARFYDQPFGNASAIPTYYCAKMAQQDGITRLLGGDGGDEIFGGNYRYAKQKLFSYYTRTPAVLRKSIIEPLLYIFPSSEKINPVSKLRSYIAQANIPMPDRMESYNLLERIGAVNVFTSQFLELVNTKKPAKMLKESYEYAHADNMTERMLAMDMRFVLADSDLPKVNKMCELAGISVSYPMLNDALVDFANRLSESQKVKGSKLRYFFKKSLDGFLPDEILKKGKQGFGLPFGVWLNKDKMLKELVFTSLESLKGKDIIQGSFLDELMNEHHVEHAAYYGTMVWVLMMLEQWMSAHNI